MNVLYQKKTVLQLSENGVVGAQNLLSHFLYQFMLIPASQEF